MAKYLIPDELSDATSYLYHHHRPWMTYSSLVPLEYRIIGQAEDAPDAFKACTYSNVIAFSSWFARKIARLSGYAAYVIAHEIGHQQLQHNLVHARWRKAGFVTGRVDERSPYVTYPFVEWIAQHAWDFQINDGINMTGMRPPEDALVDPRIGTFWDIEEDIYVRYYERNCRKQNIDPNDRTPSQPEGKPVPGAGMADVLADAGGDGRFDEDQRRLNAFQRMIDAIDQDAAKARGFSAGRAEALLKRKCVKPMPWYEIVRPSCETSLGGPKSTWNRLNKAAFSMGYVLQGNMRRASGVAAIVLDTSASMSNNERAACIEHLVGLFNTCLPRELHVLETDTEVARHTILRKPIELRSFADPIREGEKGLLGNGGTTLTAAHDYLIENGIKPDITLYFTDMGTSFPSDYGNSKRVFWISTMPHGKAPVEAGETLRMTMG